MVTLAFRRGVFKKLPILFSSDLIHGSWWFVFGSLWVMLVSLIVLCSTYYDTILGTDDSTLTESSFRVLWILLFISGFFFTLGNCFIYRNK